MNRAPFLPYVVLAAGVVLQLWIALQPLNFLLTNIIPDDSFYYFSIARNIAAGDGSTFDGENLTNGYHPLWLGILIPVFSAFSDSGTIDVTPIRAALFLNVAFSAVCALALLALARRYTNDGRIIAAALALWVFNPFTLYQMTNGLETALSLMCIGLFAVALVRFSESASLGRLLLVGLLGALMMLARLDNVFVFIAGLVWMLYHYGISVGLRHVLLTGAIATVVVAPWLAWNYTQFGMVFTSSSVSSTIVNHELVARDNGEGLAQQLRAAVYMTDRALRSIAVQTGAPSLYFIFVGVAFTFFARDRLWAAVRSLRPEVALFIGLVPIVLINATLRFTMREWYFIAFNFFFALFAAWLFARIAREFSLRWYTVVPAVLSFVAVSFISWEQVLHDRQPQQASMYASAIWMNENLPEGSRVGVFNAGIQGYFSQHSVINLDGLVNNAAAAALRDRQLWAYIEEQKIDYVSDFDLYPAYRYASFLGKTDVFARLELLHRIPERPDGVGIYRVREE